MSHCAPCTAHLDTFARDRLPPSELWPELRFDLPELQFPERLNCASELLDAWVEKGQGARLCMQGVDVRWTYADLQAQANRIAHVLVQELGVVSGNRVLLRGANSPMMAACCSWLKCSMPLLRMAWRRRSLRRAHSAWSIPLGTG